MHRRTHVALTALRALVALAPLASIMGANAAFAQTATAPAAGARWASGADPRVRYTINDGWRFLPDGIEFGEKSWLPDAGWQAVNVPHTWNAIDAFDDATSYRRGVSWYRRRLTLADSLKGKRLFLHFEGVNQVADVFVNGAWVGSHRGGYTAFTVDITKRALFDGKGNVNLIAVQVNNAHDPQIAPLSVGFALYGGIYRDVWLVATEPAHVKLTDNGSSGVFVKTPMVSRERADVQLSGTLTNDDRQPRTLRVVSTIIDAAGAKVSEAASSVRLGAGEDAAFDQRFAPVSKPHLWSPDDPYLYRVYTDVYDGTSLVDRVESPLGLRWFKWDANQGFLLNGQKLFLRGTNRHQDFQGIGSALSNQQHVRDLEIIKEMGANFLRLAHYPQDPAVLDAADRLGLLIWEEVPVVNHITVSDEFTANSQRMLREMIRQGFNHPSVVTWGLMNEVFLWSEAGERIGRMTDTTYMREVRDFARGMDRTARAEDPSRAPAMAIHGSIMYDSSGVAGVTQVLGLNLYNGWYSGKMEEFGIVLDKRHKASPNQSIFISEYGAGSELRVNAIEPERFDHSGTYHRLFHEAYIRQARTRPWLAGTAIWNEFDFSQPHIGESTPNMNKKGMLTFDRKTKDVYYLYKANWNPAPMVYIASRDWTHRAGLVGNGAPANQGATQPVDVYANVGAVELLINGRSLGTKTSDDVMKTSWQVPFVAGENVIEARGAKNGQPVIDRLIVRFDAYPAMLRDSATPFREIAVNVGSVAQYVDDDGLVWLADQPYAPGSFGYVGGKKVLMDRGVVITGTRQSPLYVDYRDGLEAYRFDVPDGDYDIDLLVADPADAPETPRAFGVLVNGHEVVPRLAARAQQGATVATPVTVRASATAGSGLIVSFKALQGQPVLNAIHVRKR